MKRWQVLAIVLAMVLSACGPILPTITPSDTPAVVIVTLTSSPSPVPSPTATATPPPSGSGKAMP